MDIELLKQLGNIDQLAGIRQYTWEGSSRIIEMYNAAGIRLTLLADKALDIYDFSHNGTNIAFHTKVGVKAQCNALGNEFYHQWQGGMLATCGLSNVGVDAAGGHPIHGRIGITPAKNVCTSARWEDGDYLLTVSGTVEEAVLYGKHLSLRRSVGMSLYSTDVTITDTVANMGGGTEEYMLLYHFNFGYPLLSEGAYFVATPTTFFARGEAGDNIRMAAPTEGRGQEFYLHTPQTDTAAAGLVNPTLELGAMIRFDTNHLPYLGQWKNMAPHDYAAAIEPCNCQGLGLADERRAGTLATIGPYASVTNELVLSVVPQNGVEDFMGRL